MPSSPETAGWELAELAELGTGMVPSMPTAPVFRAEPGAPTSPPSVFEVSSSAGVPDELLAPARSAAQAAGYAAGWASGIRAARSVADAEAHVAAVERDRAAADRSRRLAQAVAAVDHAGAVLEQRAVPAAEHIEELIVSSALAIAESLVGQVLRDDPVRSEAALTRALSLAPADEDVTVALSPADYAALGADTLTVEGISRSVTFVEDANLAPGDAFASSGATTIDARLSAGLERVRAVLGATTPGATTPGATTPGVER